MSTRAEEQRLVDGLVPSMLAKLRVNEAKGTWDGAPFERLHRLLCVETNELDAAWKKAHCCSDHRMTDAERKAIIDECADVANYAAMIAALARRHP